MRKLRILVPIIGLFACTTIINAQVGIGTTNPQATLHIVGDLKVETTNTATPTKLSGVDASGIMGDVTLGANLTLSGGTLSASGGGGDHKTETMVLIDVVFAEIDDFNLGLSGTGSYGDNSDVTVFIIRKDSGGNELKINGITGGTDGRRIRIINDSDKDIKFVEDDGDAAAGNKIYIYTEEDEMKDYGTCTLIYSTDISGDGHWCLVQLDRYN